MEERRERSACWCLLIYEQGGRTRRASVGIEKAGCVTVVMVTADDDEG